MGLVGVIGHEDLLDHAKAFREGDILRFGQILSTQAEDRTLIEQSLDFGECCIAQPRRDIDPGHFRADNGIRETYVLRPV